MIYYILLFFKKQLDSIKVHEATGNQKRVMYMQVTCIYSKGSMYSEVCGIKRIEIMKQKWTADS